ncbi:unnamed protein product [Moneuplotes crassus]|uniref:Uncharacterized protein n=1 Tax=Euplotes crassus TaxID=5936 RepID=A0AAD1X7K2_EUPCR|nr:unnamed protein product [Moneuplotes crassus]
MEEVPASQKSLPSVSQPSTNLSYDSVKITDLEKVKNLIDHIKKDLQTDIEYMETEINNVRVEISGIHNDLIDKADKTLISQMNKKLIEFVPYLEFNAMGKSLTNYCPMENHRVLEENFEALRGRLYQYELSKQVDKKFKKMQDEFNEKLTQFTTRDEFLEKQKVLQDRLMTIESDIKRNERALIEINADKLPAIIQVMDEKIDMKDLNLELRGLHLRLDQFALQDEVNNNRKSFEEFQ